MGWFDKQQKYGAKLMADMESDDCCDAFPINAVSEHDDQVVDKMVNIGQIICAAW